MYCINAYFLFILVRGEFAKQSMVGMNPRIEHLNLFNNPNLEDFHQQFCNVKMMPVTTSSPNNAKATVKQVSNKVSKSLLYNSMNDRIDIHLESFQDLVGN